jgi:flagellar biosynthesis/type III secretory pathway chaperone
MMSIQQVINTLEQLNEVHLILLEIAENKKRSIIDNDIDELNRIVSKENKLLKQISALEQERVSAVNGFLKQKGYVATASMTISTLIMMTTKADEKRSLQDAQSRLTETLKKLREANSANQELIKQSLAFIDFSIDLMAGDSSQDVTYSNQVQHQSKGYGPGLFDSKA